MKPRRIGSKTLVETLGISIVVSGIVVLIAHATGSNELASWHTDVQMSVPTAITFILTGLAFLLIVDMEE